MYRHWISEWTWHDRAMSAARVVVPLYTSAIWYHTKRYTAVWVFTTFRCSIHGDMKEFSCSVFGKLFAKNTDLAHHYRRETRSVKLSYETCDFTTSRRTDLQVHLATDADKYFYICKTCGNFYKHPSSLSRHVRENPPEWWDTLFPVHCF